jgi:hypothetical protein
MLQGEGKKPAVRLQMPRADGRMAHLAGPALLDPVLQATHQALRERRLRLARLYNTIDAAEAQVSSSERCIRESRAFLQHLGRWVPPAVWS